MDPRIWSDSERPATSPCVLFDQSNENPVAVFERLPDGSWAEYGIGEDDELLPITHREVPNLDVDFDVFFDRLVGITSLDGWRAQLPDQSDFIPMF